MVTSVIANRFKKVLPELISDYQTGFIKGRFIGENTRLVYDIMNYTEKKQKNGLLMFIDFKKAFDSISWKLMYTVLKHYNFSNEFIKWIYDISAAILQVGLLSGFFPKEAVSRVIQLFLTCLSYVHKYCVKLY